MFDRPLGRVFEDWAARQPGQPAVRTPLAEVSYGELNRHANQIADTLVRCSKPAESVATLLGDEVNQVAAFIAALKVGRRFVPIDPRFPTERAQLVIDDARADVLITDERHLQQAQQLELISTTVVSLADLDASTGGENPVASIPLETHTWIVYTSGTTGAPKGVLQNHRNLLHYLRVYAEGFRMSPDDRLTTLFPFYVNGALHDVLLALLTGGTLCPWNAKEAGFGGLDRWLVSQAATIFSSVPTAFRQFVATLDDGERFPALRLIRLWGEPSFRRDFVAFQRHAPDGAVLVNRIGASETGPVAWQFFDKDSVFDGNGLPVGRCTDGHAVRLLDRNGRAVPRGEIGEIVVVSQFLSPGYWHRDEETRAVFRDDGDEPGIRFYRTGDLARELPDGTLVPAGRRDHQVKVRGYRVEVDEIEQALVSIDGIDDAVVVAIGDAPDEPRLIAYIVAAAATAPTVTAIRHRLAAALPDYMIPAAFIRLDTFPVAANGKIARRSLPLPGRERPCLDAAYLAPATTEHVWLAELWQELLRLDQVGINDSFLELGGDSLVAAQVISRVSQKHGRDVPLKALFEHSTIAAFAQHLEAIESSGTAHRDSPIRRAARLVSP